MGEVDEPTASQPVARDYAALSELLAAERLGSYLRWSGSDVEAAFALYEWNRAASAAVIHTTGMVEVVVRNAMDRALQGLGDRRGWSSWFDAAPLEQRAQVDIRKPGSARRGSGSRTEVHGKVVAELALGFWRYLAASRYLTVLWTPALYAAFSHGPNDKLQQRRQADRRLKNLFLVRNRAAHLEPIHRKDLARDLVAAAEVTTCVDPCCRGMGRRPVDPRRIGGQQTSPSVMPAGLRAPLIHHLFVQTGADGGMRSPT